MQKVQGCILQLVMFIFSKQELRNTKRHLKYQLSFMINFYVVQCNPIKCKKRNLKYCVSRPKLFTSGDIELNPGPVVTRGNNPNNVIELLQLSISTTWLDNIRYWWCTGDCFLIEQCPISCMVNLAIT